MNTLGFQGGAMGAPSGKWNSVLAGIRTQSNTSQPVKRSRNPKRVLIIEDNIDAARSMAFLVGDMGHTVEYAINGYAGLEAARKFLPDFILLDLGLPGMDGFEVCSRVRADPSLKRTRVIVITGLAQDEHRIRAMAAGCELHLVKPVAPRVIEDLLG